MKLESPFLNKLGGLLATAAVRGWMGTLDYRAAYYDPTVDLPGSGWRRQRIYIFWHEYILCPIYLRGHCNVAMLLSRHRDAEILSHVAAHLGFGFVRGSTNRGGVAAIRQLLAASSRKLHLTITPDGPRGPRRRLAPGAIYLASKLGMPLVAMGYGYDRPWRAGSWDRFAVPRPFSRARVIFSPEIHVPPELDRDGLEHFRRRMEVLLNRLTWEAEAWAASGRPAPGEFVMRRQGVPRPCRPIGRVEDRWARSRIDF
jgi:lysophospholipid acyltransferase (LPLAT)-like uncharacterized protein